MKNYGTFAKIIVLLLLVLIAGCAKPQVVKETVPGAPEEDGHPPGHAETLGRHRRRRGPQSGPPPSAPRPSWP